MNTKKPESTDWLYKLAKKMRPDLEALSVTDRVSRVADIIGFVYTTPLAIFAVVWFVLVTDVSLFVQQWMPLLLILATQK